MIYVVIRVSILYFRYCLFVYFFSAAILQKSEAFSKLSCSSSSRSSETGLLLAAYMLTVLTAAWV